MSKRIVFLGTPTFALPVLQALMESEFVVAAVFTQPDRPTGRGNRMEAPPVKQMAQSAGIPVYQFEQIKSPQGVDALRELHPDALVTAAFGQMLSQDILDIPPMGCINVHASLLPRYRGAAPVQWALIRGELETGITTMLTDIGMDTGPILLQEALQVHDLDTVGTLLPRLAALGGPLLVRTLRGMLQGSIQPMAQNHEQATKAPPLRRRHEALRWQLPARRVVGWIRGLSPAPGAYGTLLGQRFKFYQAAASTGESGKPGQILRANAKHGLWIACGDGVVEILELQSPGGKRMSAKAYLAGKQLPEGACFDTEVENDGH